MTDPTVVRAFATAVLLTLGIAVGMYVLNPLRTASSDPRIRVSGYMLAAGYLNRSMEPTIHLNDTLVVSAWPYRDADPAPGDVVVFQYPRDMAVADVKRVIATGGSTLEIRDGVPFVDGKRVDEPYVDPRNNVNALSQSTYSFRVPVNAFFVMGDNRDNSDDSRSWGFVPRTHIIGKVISRSAPN
jgi:signal peptidase I